MVTGTSSRPGSNARTPIWPQPAFGHQGDGPLHQSPAPGRIVVQRVDGIAAHPQTLAQVAAQFGKHGFAVGLVEELVVELVEALGLDLGGHAHAVVDEAELARCTGCYLDTPLADGLRHLRISIAAGTTQLGGLSLSAQTDRRVRWDLYLAPMP